jgi:tetratricopeptide (TPR) repeat protein
MRDFRTAVFSFHFILGAALLSFAGCTNEQVNKSLHDGFAKYSNRQLDESEAIADKLIRENPTSPNIDEMFYLRGISRLTKGNKAGASADLAQAASKTTRADLKAKAFRALGDIEYESQHWREAEAQYQKALDSGGMSPENTNLLNYRMGACLQARGEWRQASPWFGRVAVNKLDTALADRSLARMNMSSFALQYGAFSEVARAREMGNQLQAAGVTPAIVSETREGKVLFLVRSGSYRTFAEASAARDKIISKYPLVAIVP